MKHIVSFFAGLFSGSFFGLIISAAITAAGIQDRITELYHVQMLKIDKLRNFVKSGADESETSADARLAIMQYIDKNFPKYPRGEDK